MQARELFGKWLHSNCDRRILRGGSKLSENDTKRAITAFALWCSILLELPCSCNARLTSWYRRNCTAANAMNLFRWFLRSDIIVVIDIFKEMKSAYQHLPVNGSERRVKSFLRRSLVATKDCPVLYSLIFYMLYECAVNFDYEFSRHVNTLCQFFLRLLLVDGTEDFEAEALEKYVENERQMSHPDSSAYKEILPAIQSTIYGWFKDFDATEYASYQHTYGATTEVHRSVGTAAKVKAFRLTDEVARVLRWLGISINPNLYEWGPELCLAGVLLEHGIPPELPCLDVVPKYMTVPKGIDKRRGITPEPTVRSWLQKLVAHSLKKYMASRPYFHVDLFDQDYNRDLAQGGSYDGSYSTGDMSDASDLIQWSVVQDCFALVPDLVNVFDMCRSTHVRLVTGEVLQLKKHAPMGSALCFPVMCIIISAVIHVVYRRRGIHADYRVYGDDFVVASIVFLEVCRYLEALGFRINYDKSFDASVPYKESCGIEAVLGYDVTPLRVSRNLDLLLDAKKCDKVIQSEHDRNNDDQGQFKGFVSLVNRLNSYGYKVTRRSLLAMLRSEFPGVVFSHNENYGVFTNAEILNNEHLKRRKRYRYAIPGTTDISRSGPFEWEYRVQDLKTETRLGPQELNYALKLERMSYRPENYAPTPEDRGDVRSGPAKSTLKWIWVPEELLCNSSR